MVLVAAAIADRAGGEIDGERVGTAAGAGEVVGGAGECEGKRVRDGDGRSGKADRVVGGGGHEVACDRAAGGVDDRLAGVEGGVGGDGDHLGAGVDVGGGEVEGEREPVPAPIGNTLRKSGT